jgi:hypothetical protein
MDMNFKKVFLAIIGFGLVASVLNCHNWKNKSPEERANYMAEKINKHLDLDNNQKELVNKIKLEWIAKHKDLKTNFNFKEEILPLIKSDKLDDEKLKLISQKMSTNRQEMDKFIIEKFKEFHAVLNKDQKEKMAEHLEKMHKRFGHAID